MLTNNSQRKPEQVDAANPRADNDFGHIIEMTPAGRRPRRADSSPGRSWSSAAIPRSPRSARRFSSDTTKNGWFGMPDNCAFDSQGRLWIATDGNNAKATGRADGLWAMETEGELRGTSKHFFRVPVGCRDVRPVLHARRRDPVPRRSASRRRRRKARLSASRIRSPAGPTSRTACRRGRRCSSITKQGGGKIA